MQTDTRYFNRHFPLCAWPNEYDDPLGFLFPDFLSRVDHPWHLEPIDDEI